MSYSVAKTGALLFLMLSSAVVVHTSHAQTKNSEIDSNLKNQCPIFSDEVIQATHFMDSMIKAGINVPVPVDPGGGYTHEQHKRNYKAIFTGGMLYKTTGNNHYLSYVHDLLIAYAKIYPSLGPHPAAKENEAGRLFWQNLNDSVWLVYSIQGYAAARDTYSEADRKFIEDNLFRKAAIFLSDGSPRTMYRIHNHATWASAAIGMTGYVLGNKDFVEKALLGPDRDGKYGFLRQMDLLFSPDGYYAEGPYYQRYSMLPYMVFAEQIQKYDPARDIFNYRDQILLKNLNATIQQTYNGYFFPINDALKEKSLNTDELYQGVSIAYAQTKNAELLSIVKQQDRTALTESGKRIACDAKSLSSKPFNYQSLLLRDGANGDEGAVAIFRNGVASVSQALVVKNTSQGMGHGHFDKLGWLYYDNGFEIIRDYGAARFLNIEAKNGGHYLAENNSWAKQTIAHNTLVEDQQSHFDGNLKQAEKIAPKQILYSNNPDLQISVASVDDAYPGTKMQRTMLMLTMQGYKQPFVVDIFKYKSDKPHQLDLPLHFQGHIMRVGPKLDMHTDQRPVLGKANGYQHVWVDGAAKPTQENAFVTWLMGNRFYTYRWIPQTGAELILAESGANDPSFNLRREQFLLQRVKDTQETVFVGVLETHGSFDGASEQTIASDTRIKSIAYQTINDYEVLEITPLSGSSLIIILSKKSDQNVSHSVTYKDKRYEWKGYATRFELKKGKSSP